MSLFQRLFGSKSQQVAKPAVESQTAKPPSVVSPSKKGPIALAPSAIVNVEICLAETYLRSMRSGTQDATLFQTLFRATNPSYPLDGITGSLYGTPMGKDERVKDYMARVTDRAKADSSLHCAVQGRVMTLRINGQICKVDVAVCTYFRKKHDQDHQEILISDDTTVTLCC